MTGLLTDPDAAWQLRRSFAMPYAGGWAVGHWHMSPKLYQAGWWFACFWDGDRTWTAVYGDIPAAIPGGTAVFPSVDAAEKALRDRGLWREPGEETGLRAEPSGAGAAQEGNPDDRP